MKIAFLSTYIPRECGIATYTHNLIKAIKEAEPTTKFGVVAMNDDQDYCYSDHVVKMIQQDSNQSYIEAAEFINNSDFDVVSIQHEFGIFGGFNGRNVLLFLKYLKKPCFLTLHTVPIFQDTPFKIRAKRFKSRAKLLNEIISKVGGVTVMNNHAKTFLIEQLKVSKEKIIVIPHGSPRLTKESIESFRKKKEDLNISENEIVLSTFGLLSPKKGLEYSIKALDRVRKKFPGLGIKYFIIGTYHSKKGPDYLNYLKKLVTDLKLTETVIFDSRYLDYNQIYKYLANTDIYITPYYTREQSSSGTLSYAVAAGCCVVTTPYVYANDAVKNYKIGLLTKFRDANSIADSIIVLISDQKMLNQFKDNSYNFGKTIWWPKIGRDFLDYFERGINENSNCRGSK